MDDTSIDTTISNSNSTFFTNRIQAVRSGNDLSNHNIIDIGSRSEFLDDNMHLEKDDDDEVNKG